MNYQELSPQGETLLKEIIDLQASGQDNAAYWNKRFDGLSMQQDTLLRGAEEGLQTMRTLAANMAWLMRCIEAADQAGVPRPEYEAPMRTDFIRRS